VAFNTEKPAILSGLNPKNFHFINKKQVFLFYKQLLTQEFRNRIKYFAKFFDLKNF
jgi:hypothetical protein